MATSITISTPKSFNFAAVVLSHGWCELPPFEYDDRDGALYRAESISGKPPMRLRISEADSSNLRVECSSTLTRSERETIERSVRVCLQIDQDLRPFYAALKGRPRYRWVAKAGAGRLLVAPTVWEDLAKTLMTTNTTWVVTVQMCRRLAALGPASGTLTAFPSPETIAAYDPDKLTAIVRAGYRTPYLHELATKIANGRIDVEAWRRPEMPTEEIYKALKGIKGYGDYAAGSMLKLLGRFDRLGIDTSCRDVFKMQINKGEPASDEQIRRYYDDFGAWRGLALWMDVMKVGMAKNLAAYARLPR